MTALAILGLGSPFGDDRAGWAAIDAIRDSAWLRALPEGAVRLECLDRPGAALVARLAGVRHAVLIDAMRSGAPPGTIRLLTREALGRHPCAGASTHGFGVAQALALGAALGQLPPGLAVFGIEAADTSVAGELSPALRAALPVLVARAGEHVLATLGLSAAACG